MTGGCVFCNRANFEERLVGITEDCYVIATLGQITDGGYVLIVPREHVSCIGAFSQEQMQRLLRARLRVCWALSMEYQLEGGPLIAFEHGIVGQTIRHAHLHLMPAGINLTPLVAADFPEANKETLPGISGLGERYCAMRQPYLFWTTPAGERIVCWNPAAPPQYLRLAAAHALGRPDRGDWRKMDPALDRTLWQDTVRLLGPYFQR